MTVAEVEKSFCFNRLVKSSIPAAQETRASRVAPPPGQEPPRRDEPLSSARHVVAAVPVRRCGTLAACAFVFLRSVPRPGWHHRPGRAKAAMGSKMESVTARDHNTHWLHNCNMTLKRQGRRTWWSDALVEHDDVRPAGAATTSWRRDAPDATPFAMQCWNATQASLLPS